MKKNFRTQMLTAVSMLIVAAVALTSVTYAWFSSVANPTVDNIDMYVGASDTMMLSEFLAMPALDDTAKWHSNVTKAMITAEQTYAFPAELKDVSSVFTAASNAFYKISAFNTTGTPKTMTSAVAPTSSAFGDYVKFDLWIKSTNDGYVYLNKDSLVQAINQLAGTVISTVPGKHIADTIRIGFVPLNYDADGFGGTAAGTGASWANAVLWEPNSTSHLPNAGYGGPTGTGKLSTTAISDISVNAGAYADTVKTAQPCFDWAVNNKASVGTITGTGAPTDDAIVLFNMRANVPQQFSIYIWVEGEDADTLDAVTQNFFRTYLKFGQAKDTFYGTYAFS